MLIALCSNRLSSFHVEPVTTKKFGGNNPVNLEGIEV